MKAITALRIFIGAYFLQYFLTSDLMVLPRIFVWTDELILLFLAFKYSPRILSGSHGLKLDSTRWFFAFIAVGLLSAMFNGTLLRINTPLGLRSLLQGPLLFYLLLVLDLSDKERKSLINLVWVFILLQAPLSIYQGLTYNPNADYKIVDAMHGMFLYGASNLLGIFLMQFILLLQPMKKYGVITSKRYWVYTSIIVLTFLLCFSKIAYPLLLIGFILVYHLSGVMERKPTRTRRLITRIVYLGAFSVLIFYGLAKANLLGPESAAMLTPEGLQQLWVMQIDPRQSGRLFVLVSSVLDQSKHLLELLFGWGPGNFSSYAGFNLNAPRLGPWLEIFEIRGARFDADLLTLQSEYGLIGMSMYYLFVWTILRDVWKRRSSSEDPFWKAQRIGLYAYGVPFLLASTINGTFQGQWIMYTFWLFAGLILGRDGHHMVPDKGES